LFSLSGGQCQCLSWQGERIGVRAVCSWPLLLEQQGFGMHGVCSRSVFIDWLGFLLGLSPWFGTII
jgi:hypothetical protein